MSPSCLVVESRVKCLECSPLPMIVVIVSLQRYHTVVTYRDADKLFLARRSNEKISGLLGTSSLSRGTDRLLGDITVNFLSFLARILFRWLPYSIARSIKLFLLLTDPRGLESTVLRPVLLQSDPLWSSDAWLWLPSVTAPLCDGSGVDSRSCRAAFLRLRATTGTSDLGSIVDSTPECRHPSLMSPATNAQSPIYGLK